MDRLIVAEKLESLRRCVRRIESRRANSAEALARDVDRQDILSLNLTRAVQLCVDMGMHLVADREELAPQSMGEAFQSLASMGAIDGALAARMKAAVGIRSIAVHNYQSIDWTIVHRITHEGLDDFRRFARAVGAVLDGG